MSARIGIFAAVFGLCLQLGGCTHVHPYEREYLARPGMDLKREALASEFEGHVHDAREGATGSSSDSTGGGCGCN